MKSCVLREEFSTTSIVNFLYQITQQRFYLSRFTSKVRQLQAIIFRFVLPKAERERRGYSEQLVAFGWL
jgi:hypothetical protein